MRAQYKSYIAWVLAMRCAVARGALVVEGGTCESLIPAHWLISYPPPLLIPEFTLYLSYCKDFHNYQCLNLTKIVSTISCVRCKLFYELNIHLNFTRHSFYFPKLVWEILMIYKIFAIVLIHQVGEDGKPLVLLPKFTTFCANFGFWEVNRRRSHVRPLQNIPSSNIDHWHW